MPQRPAGSPKRKRMQRSGREDVKVNAFVQYRSDSGRFHGLKFNQGMPSKENKPWGDRPELVRGIYPRVKQVIPVGEHGTGISYFRSRRTGDWRQLQSELEKKGYRVEVVFYEDKTHKTHEIKIDDVPKKHGVMGQAFFKVYRGHERIKGQSLVDLMHSLRSWKPVPEYPGQRRPKEN